jgi:hypothetical protein
VLALLLKQDDAIIHRYSLNLSFVLVAAVVWLRVFPVLSVYLPLLFSVLPSADSSFRLL